MTKKQIESVIPGAVAAFRFHMLPIDAPYPSIRFSTARTFKKVRNELVKSTGCKLKGIPDDSSLEYIHGDLGGAVLIRMDQLPDGMRHEHFLHFFWHELGHFYAICSDTQDLERFDDPDNVPDEKNALVIQRGYWFWSEFIAEAISLHVDYKVRSAEPTYHPETIDWKAENWGWMVDRLMHHLDQAFYSFIYPGPDVDEYELSMFFATLLMDDFCRLYVQAAKDGKQKKSGKDIPEPPGTIEPTCISDQNEHFQPMLWEMKGILEEQVRKERFWEIDKDTVETLGKLIFEMDAVKMKLMNEEY